MENRPVMENNYRALGIAYSNDSVLSVFPESSTSSTSDIQIIRSEKYHPVQLVPLIKETMHDEILPEALGNHRRMEPLIWLKHQGIQAPTMREESLTITAVYNRQIFSLGVELLKAEYR